MIPSVALEQMFNKFNIPLFVRKFVHASIGKLAIKVIIDPAIVIGKTLIKPPEIALKGSKKKVV